MSYEKPEFASNKNQNVEPATTTSTSTKNPNLASINNTLIYPTEIKSHVFVTLSNEVLTWCDACAGLIWPLLGSSCARCKYCYLTVHIRCLAVLLDSSDNLPTCRNRPVKLKPQNNKNHNNNNYNNTRNLNYVTNTSIASKITLPTSKNLQNQKMQVPVLTENSFSGSQAHHQTKNVQQKFRENTKPKPSHNQNQNSTQIVRSLPSSFPKMSDLPPHTATIRKNFQSPYHLAKQIQEYNNSVKNQLKMSLHEDGITFRGYVRVTVDLKRPVTISGPHKSSKQQTNQVKTKFGIHEKQPSKSSSGHHSADNSISPESTTHEILPKFLCKKFDVFSKNLHLTSQTTAEDVISALLSRYKITTHMKKFALYERSQKTDEHYVISRLSYDSRPLLLRLLHGKNSPEGVHSFMLMENDIDGIEWTQFSVAELISFLKIIGGGFLGMWRDFWIYVY